MSILTAGLLWGLIGLFVRRLNAAGIPSMGQVAWRSAVSAAIMFAWLAAKNPAGLKIRLKDVWMFVGTGIISFALFNYCYFGAISRISLSLAAVLLYTAPIFVMLMSKILFKEPVTRRKLTALAFAFTGCALSAGAVTLGGGDVSGMVLGLMSGFLYALYSIFGRFALNKYTAQTVTAYTFLAAFAASAPFAGNAFSAAFDIRLLLLLILFAVVSGVLPYFLYTSGLAKISPDRASIIASIEPIAATAVGALFFNEPLTPASTAGTVLVISAILLLNTGKKHGLKNSYK